MLRGDHGILKSDAGRFLSQNPEVVGTLLRFVIEERLPLPEQPPVAGAENPRFDFGERERTQRTSSKSRFMPWKPWRKLATSIPTRRRQRWPFPRMPRGLQGIRKDRESQHAHLRLPSCGSPRCGCREASHDGGRDSRNLDPANRHRGRVPKRSGNSPRPSPTRNANRLSFA